MVPQPSRENRLVLDDFHQTLAGLIYVHEDEPINKMIKYYIYQLWCHQNIHKGNVFNNEL